MNLIPLTSPLYLKRLIREINSINWRGGAVYLKAYPHNVPVKSVVYGPNLNVIIVTDRGNALHPGKAGEFFTGAGEEICASRD